MMAEQLGFLIGQFIGALLLIYFGSMLVGWLLKALVGEALSWARAEPGEEGYMKRMWVTHSLPLETQVDFARSVRTRSGLRTCTRIM